MYKEWKNQLFYTIALTFVVLAFCSCRSTDGGTENQKTPTLSEHDDATVVTGKAMAEKYMESFKDTCIRRLLGLH